MARTLLRPLDMNDPMAAIEETSTVRAIYVAGLDMAQALYLYDSCDVEWSQVDHGREYGTWADIDRLPAGCECTDSGRCDACYVTIDDVHHWHGLC